MAFTVNNLKSWITLAARSPKRNQEEEGLLSGVPSPALKQDSEIDNRTWSSKRIVGTATFFIALLISGAFTRTLLCGTPAAHTLSGWYKEGYFLSNGTHEFKRTVLIVSIDGLRSVLQCCIMSTVEL